MAPTKKTTRKKKTARKKKKMTAAEFRFNLILLAAVFVISAVLLAVRHFPENPSASSAQPASSAPAVSRPSSPGASPPEAPPSAARESPASSPLVEAPSASSPVAAPAVERTAPAQKPETPPPVKEPAGAGGKLPPTVKAPQPRKPVPPQKTEPLKVAAPAAPPVEKPLPPKKKGTLLFVFDDAGHNLAQLEPFLRLPFPCTIAVLPGLQYSREAAKRIRASGKELILHQPMQALNLKMDPGPGAIRQGMSADEIRAVVRENLDEVWPVAGMNNHEGSMITADREAMKTVLEIARERGIYFLDSRTNSATAAPAAARDLNMTIWERAVFLDNSQDRIEIMEAVRNGMHIAEKKGTAIMIGHIWSNDLANILVEMYPELAAQGFSLSTIARIAVEGDFEE